MADVELVKKYLRIDGSEEDDILALYVASAIEYLSNAGVKEPDKQSNLYDLAVVQYVKKEYARDEREVEMTEKSLSSIVLQLKEYGGVES